VKKIDWSGRSRNGEWSGERTNAAFHSSREVVFTRSRDPGNHEFTTSRLEWNAAL